MKTGQALIQEIDTLSLARGEAAFWWLGQMGYVLKIADQVFYLDPYLAPSPARQIPPLLAPEDVVNANWVLGSHPHSDHIDRTAIPGIAGTSPQARFVCSRVAAVSVRELGVPEERIVGLDDRASHQDGPVRISAIAAQHEFFDRDPVLGYPYLCFIIECDGVTVLHAGDTLRYDGMLAKLSPWQFDLAFLPINGRDAERLARNCLGNMTYQEAVDMAGDLQPRLTVPGHYDMFANNSEDPRKFTAYMDVKFPRLKYWVGEHGTPVILAR